MTAETSDPDPFARAADELGEPDAVYAVGPGRVRAKYALAAGLLLYGVVANYLWWVVGPARFDHLVLLILLGPTLSGVSVLRHTVRARGLHVLAYPTGLLRVHGREIESYPWAEMDKVRIRSDRGEVRFERDDDGRLTACWVDVEPPLVKFWDAELIVRRRDGTEAAFTPALTNYPDLVERVQRGTFAALWPGVRGQLLAGEALSFGPFEVSPDGLRFNNTTLRWADVSKVEFGQKHLSVKRRGKWLPWAVSELAAVSNPHLMLAVTEEMRGPDRSDEPDDRGEGGTGPL